MKILWFCVYRTRKLTCLCDAWVWLRQSLDNLVSYHHVQYQQKLMIQSWENLVSGRQTHQRMWSSRASKIKRNKPPYQSANEVLFVHHYLSPSLKRLSCRFVRNEKCITTLAQNFWKVNKSWRQKRCGTNHMYVLLK